MDKLTSNLSSVHAPSFGCQIFTNFTNIPIFQLSFKKGDLVTVTQKLDGGWWEGTSQETGKTGWFPSNYATDYKETTPTSETGSTSGVTGTTSVVPTIDPTTAAELLARQIENRQQIIRELVEKEKEFVAELQNLLTTYLEPLSKTEL
jgi:hypothetical protein